ncbi:MAG: hypothetical protein LBO20_06695, partial [Bifidobacteriaceae bacterium]|nr:hypothetical protein [Bifidobacteriaceae bacterium]
MDLPIRFRLRPKTILAGALVVALGSASALALASLGLGGARASGQTVLTVNSTALTEASSSCATVSGVCTLRQAIEEANATPADTDVLIQVEPGLSGAIAFPGAADQLMTTTAASPDDSGGAVFWARRPMTIDLDNRIGLAVADGAQPGPLNQVAGIWVDGPGVKLRNFTDWFATQSGVVFSPNAAGSSLEGGETVQVDNNHLDRQVLVMGGASDITIADYRMGRAAEAGVAVKSPSGTTTISGLTIAGVVFDNAPSSGGACLETDGGACSPDGIYSGPDLSLANFTVADSEFRDFIGGGQPIDLARGGAMRAAWDIKDNTFTNIRAGAGESEAALALPSGQSFDLSDPTPNHIRDNRFDNQAAAGLQGIAIFWESNATSADGAKASRLFIQDNRFDGYTDTIRLRSARTVTVTRNTFGPNTTASTTTTGEETGDGKVMFDNQGLTNGKINPWTPGNATVYCSSISIVVKPPVNTPIPNSKSINIDVYWTGAGRAEIFIATLTNVSDSGSSGYSATIPNIKVPRGGAVRLQAQAYTDQDPQRQSSQYSRSNPLLSIGDCPAEVASTEIDLRAWNKVPAGATTHDQIIDPASGAVELPDGSPLPLGAGIWFTYTVRNTGSVPINDLVVRDSVSQKNVCVIKQLAAGATAGCARRHV